MELERKYFNNNDEFIHFEVKILLGECLFICLRSKRMETKMMLSQ